MSVTQSAHSLGSFSLLLTDQTPDEVWNAIGYFGHVAIFDGPVDVAAIGDAGLTAARYVGVLRQKGKPSGSRSLGGSGMLFWLGDEDGKGAVAENKLTFTNASLTTVLNAVFGLQDACTIGVVHDPGGTYSGTHQWQSPRTILDIVCDAFGIEYRVNNDATVDFGTQAQLYRTLPGTSPAPLVVRRSPGEDTDVEAVGTDFETDSAVVDYSTRIVLLGQTTDATQFATGTVDAPVVPYRDLKGNPVKFTRLISESDQTTGSVQARAQLQLNRYNRVTRSLDVNPTDYELVGAFTPGDDTFVFDEESGITNAAYEVTYHGEVLHPDIIRVTEMTWSVAEGMTVGFRDQTGIWYDLTPFVTYETMPPQLIVGDLPYSLSQPGDDAFTIRTDSAAGQTPADSTIPGVPGNLVLSTSSILDTSGRTVSVIDATWNTPLNTDGSVITDLDYFVFRYRPTGRLNWLASYSASTSIEVVTIPDLDYEAQIAAVDTSGHQGAWSASSNIHTSKDAIAPPAPADPLVGSYLGQLRIQYLGTPAGGGVMPSDTDRIRVEVATSAAGPWTFVDSLNPFISTVTYTDAPYGSLRYVRLSAIDRDGNVSAYSGIVSGSTVQVADGDVASMSIGKLITGTMLTDFLVAGRITNGTTGQRYELNAAGLQMWNVSGSQTVNINGASNLLVGTLQTDLAPNRRIVSGAAGSAGSIQFISPDGTLSKIEGWTAPSGDEAWRVSIPIAGTHQYYNSLQLQENQLAFWNAAEIDLNFRDRLKISQADNGTPSVPPVLSTRIDLSPTFMNFIDPDGLAMLTSGGKGSDTNWRYWGDVSNSGRFIISEQNAVSNVQAARLIMGFGGETTFYRSPGFDFSVQERAPGGGSISTRFRITDTHDWFQWPGTGSRLLIMPPVDDLTSRPDISGRIQMVNHYGYGAVIRYLSTSTGGSARIDFIPAAGTGFVDLTCGTVTQSSSMKTKTAIKKFTGDPLSVVRRAELSSFRRRGHRAMDGTQGGEGPVEHGFIVEQVPPELATADENGERVGVNTMAALAFAIGAIQQLAAQVDALRKGKS